MKLRRYVERASIVIVVMVALLCISVSATELLVGGQTVGMKVKLHGLLVTSVESDSPAYRAGLRSGDCLLAIGGTPLENVDQLTDRIQSGSVLVLNVLRGGDERTLFIQPEQEANGFRLGAAVRDDLAGIGTVTYYNPETGAFGALGHGICDFGGKTLLKIDGGVIVPSKIVGIEKSLTGKAGQLQGDFEVDNRIGTIDVNTPYGIFGKTEPNTVIKMETASVEEISLGEAVIRVNVKDDTVEEFRVEIVSKLPGGAYSGKDLLIRIIDPKLLNVTGGIVQGMSGSPIIQNGKLIGAVTHVLINSPDYGYGIFIDRMLESEKRSDVSTSSFSFLHISTKFS